jgi:hypothetical protein
MDDEKEIRTEKWASGKHKNKSKNRELKYQLRQHSHMSLDNKQNFYGHKHQVNNGYKQLFKSTELSNDLLPKNERVYHMLSSDRRMIRAHRVYKHNVSKADKMEKQRINAKEVDETLINSNQCISPQFSHFSADYPQI